MASLLRSLYSRSPVVCNVVAYGTLYSAGDVSQQTICRKPQYDLANTRRMGAVGAAIFGPLYTYWYRYLDKFLPGTAGKMVVKKVLADTSVMGPVGVVLFYTACSILEGKEDIFQEAVEKGPKTFLTGCIYWPGVQVLNFVLVPPAYRALYTGAAAFIWTNILCYIKSNQSSASRFDAVAAGLMLQLNGGIKPAVSLHQGNIKPAAFPSSPYQVNTKSAATESDLH